MEDEPEREPEEEELEKGEAVEEEPLMEPEDGPPWMPGEETWTCESCMESTGVSQTKCWHCGERRGGGTKAELWGELNSHTDTSYSKVIGVLHEGTVHTVDGWQLPMSYGGQEVLRRRQRPGDDGGAQEAPRPSLSGAAAAGAESEAEEEWATMSPWQIWHRRKDNHLVLYNSDTKEYPASFPRAS
uniref:RanBP2-type domain-containing protein n=1 Tax=Alexandrium catenella TaxID=2925 RepID=A0A7S1LAI2_ALECA